MFSTISHLKDNTVSNCVNVLMVGAEGTGKHDISKSLVDLATTVKVKVHTCSCLPVPEDSQLYNTSVDFVCFMLHLSSKESFETVSYSLSKLDVNYFLGRAVIIINTKDSVQTEQTGDSVLLYSVRALAAQYGVPVFFRNTKVEQDRVDLSRKLMMMVQTAVGLTTSVSPLLLDTMSV